MGFGATAPDAAAAAAADPASTPPAGLPDATPPPDPAQPAADTGVAADGSPLQGDATGDGQVPPAQAGDDPSPAPAWAAAPDVDTVLGVEAVATRVTELKAEAQEEGRRTAQGQLQPLLQGNQRRLEEIRKGTSEFTRSWNKLVRNGNITTQEATELIEDHRGTFETLAQVQMESGRWEGRGEWIDIAAKLDPSISQEFGPRFQALQQGLDDPTFTDDFLKAVGKAVAGPIKTELQEANAHIARLEQEARDAGRNGQPAPVKTAGLGGSGIINTTESARLDRLAYGRDADGNPPTEEDKAWIAERGN